MEKRTLIIEQIKSSIGCIKSQKQALLGLGLKKIRDKRELEDTPSIRGMINKVSHIVKIQGAQGQKRNEAE